MTNRTHFIALATILVSGCASIASGPEDCSKQNLNLTLDLNKMHLVPKTAKCVTAGAVVRMKITVNGSDLQIDAGDVVIAPKPGNPAWLNGSNNTDPREIAFTVPGNVGIGQEFKYLISVPKVGVLDPIVRVID